MSEFVLNANNLVYALFIIFYSIYFFNYYRKLFNDLLQEINEEWLSDKSRFAIDGLKRQRLVTPMLRKSGSQLEVVDWESALIAVCKALQGVEPCQVLTQLHVVILL